jgi:hypothetical protein
VHCRTSQRLVIQPDHSFDQERGPFSKRVRLTSASCSAIHLSLRTKASHIRSFSDCWPRGSSPRRLRAIIRRAIGRRKKGLEKYSYIEKGEKRGGGDKPMTSKAVQKMSLRIDNRKFDLCSITFPMEDEWRYEGRRRKCRRREQTIRSHVGHRCWKKESEN